MGNSVTYSALTDEEQYGCHSNQVKNDRAAMMQKEGAYNEGLSKLQQQLQNIESVQSQKENEYKQEIQQTNNKYEQQRTEEENEWKNTLDQKNKYWDQKLQSETDTLDKEIKEKEAIMDVEQHENVLVPVSVQYRHKYQPSLSNGMYGHYVIKKEIHNKSNKSNQTSSHINIDATMYDKIYAKAKESDNKHLLIFKAECNVKGCCNKPEVDSKLLQGDMYVCKHHRIEMANKIKQCGLNGDIAEHIIDKLNNMNDAQLLKQGQVMVNNDYFLDTYTKLQQQRTKIAKKMLTLKRSQSLYWTLKIEYKQLQKACDFLVLIRKISNPWAFTIIDDVVNEFIIHPIVHCLCLGLCCCRKKRKKRKKRTTRKERIQQEKERKEREKKNKERMDALTNIIDNLSSQINDKETMKNECIQLTKTEEKKYNDKLDELENKLSELEWTDEKENYWTNLINTQKQESKQAEVGKEKGLEQHIKQETERMKQKEVDEKNKWDGWIIKKTQVQQALKTINDEINAATKEALKDDKECHELETQLDEEEFNEAVWEKKMDRLEKLEEKRLKNADKLKALNDKLDDEKKKQENESKADGIPMGDVNQLKETMKWKLDELQKMRNDEINRLKDQKQKKMDEMREKHEKKIQEIEGKRDEKKQELSEKRENAQEKLNTHKTVEKTKLETFKSEQTRKHRNYEQEQDELNWESAKSKAEYLARDTSDGWVGLYVAYDSRDSFQSWYKAYSPYSDDTYCSYGHYKICKIVGKYYKGYWNLFKYKTSGRSSAWYHFYDGQKSTYTSDGWSVYEM